jgi:hypothetical protein
MKNELTDAQKEVLEKCPKKGWFTYESDLLMLIKNVRSHLQKLEGKGYLEGKMFPDKKYPYPESIINGTYKYRRAHENP